MSKKKRNIFANILLLFAVLTFIIGLNADAKIICANKQIENTNKKTNTDLDILSSVDTYQEQYFTIIKRNNVLLDNQKENNLNKDRKELKILYKKVEKQITNRQYLKKYKDIEKRYSKCNAITTPDINEFADNYYNEIDALLNEVYKKVQSQISPEDFKKLTQSEKNWLKEVDNYKKVFDSMEYGTIGTMMYYDYQTNMKKFRTLLLMLYL